MDPSVVCALIAAAASILVAAMSVHTKRTNDKVLKSSKDMEERAEVRKQESMLSLQMMDATLQLSIVCSNALTGGHNNGNVERARTAAEKAAKKYEDFIREVAADSLLT